MRLSEQSKKDIDRAFKALEERDELLDKIRAEIKGLTYYWCEVHPKSVIDDVLQIIDKYRNEVSNTDARV